MIWNRPAGSPMGNRGTGWSLWREIWLKWQVRMFSIFFFLLSHFFFYSLICFILLQYVLYCPFFLTKFLLPFSSSCSAIIMFSLLFLHFFFLSLSWFYSFLLLSICFHPHSFLISLYLPPSFLIFSSFTCFSLYLLVTYLILPNRTVQFILVFSDLCRQSP